MDSNRYPISSLESAIEENKEGYCFALRQTQTTLGNSLREWHPWILIFLHALTRQKDNLLDRHAAERTPLATLTLCIRQLSDRPSRVSVASIVAATGCQPQHGQSHSHPSRQRRLLVRHGAGRSVHYTQR